ncbi:peptidoglycan-binding protein [Nonomuraea longicatena]|uniref:Peptidoglycan-binding protein n=1 Tax=Nonomuraea longicatena TaxID=83682 RepID=A0ABP4ATU0_9ACTN
MRGARPALFTAGAALLAAAVTAAVLGIGGGDGRTAATTRIPPATARVERATLTDTTTVDGTLGYGADRTVTARGGGTITWLPAEGATVTRGRAVYSVDADRVPLLYGSMPLYRTLDTGAEGMDVELLERNLSKLGYDGFDIDGEYTWATREAVKEWQDDLGLPVTGKVAADDVVVSDGPLRVAELKTQPGAAAGGAVLTTTGTVREVTVDLDAGDRHLVKKNMRAEVELPDGEKTDGRISSIGKTATQTGQGQDATTTVEATVAVRGVKGFDTGPVEVTFVSERRENVLAVPVGALLALAEGGYGVQVVEGGTTRYVAVKTGMFADGRVEVTGVAEGATVAVPA